jgi:GNAT superfamily N-acetyltransferase
MVLIRKSCKSDRDAIYDLYANLSPTIPVGEETQFIALDDDLVLGIVRLTEEEGHFVLRGMNIQKGYKRQGLGKALLKELEPHINGRDCYCIPHAYLSEFYGTIGFEQIPLEEAPLHLQERHALYLSMGFDAVIMKRSGN